MLIAVVAKQANARYTPDAITWVKIKNRHYTQAIGRHDFFNRPKHNRKLWRHTLPKSGSPFVPAQSD